MKADWIKFENKLEIPMMETHIRYIMVSLHSEVMKKVAAQYFERAATETEMSIFRIREINGKRYVYAGTERLGEIEFIAVQENDQWEMGYKFTPLI